MLRGRGRSVTLSSATGTFGYGPFRGVRRRYWRVPCAQDTRRVCGVGAFARYWRASRAEG